MMRMVKVRKVLGLSQSGLARVAEMHVSSLCAIETGRMKPWPGQSAKIARALDWPLERAGELFEEVAE
jgi:DNA-binding XRE family transcriptional regulator